MYSNRNSPSQSVRQCVVKVTRVRAVLRVCDVLSTLRFGGVRHYRHRAQPCEADRGTPKYMEHGMGTSAQRVARNSLVGERCVRRFSNVLALPP